LRKHAYAESSFSSIKILVASLGTTFRLYTFMLPVIVHEADHEVQITLSHREIKYTRNL